MTAHRVITLLLLLAPAAVLLANLVSGQYGGRPFEALQDKTGFWAATFLLVSLTITPLARAWRWSRLIGLRRIVGLGAFGYAFAHLAGFAADNGFDPGFVASEIGERAYLTIGFAALVAMGVLAATSTDGMVRRISPQRWKLLHRLTYAAGVLMLVHVGLQVRLDPTAAILATGIFAWLMAARVASAVAPGAMKRWWGWAVLTLVLAVSTAFCEAMLLEVTRDYPLAMGLAEQVPRGLDRFAPLWGVRPALILFAAGAMISVGAAWRLRPRNARSRT